MEKVLTVVVPTYNMEKYLDRCLSSLIIEDEKMGMLEVLVINDGSKDRSSEIAHGYEARYPQTFRVIDKENGNYGSCVNRGLAEATGKYIKILDADDWFETGNIGQFLIFLSDSCCDCILTDHYVKGYGENKISFPDLLTSTSFGFDALSDEDIKKISMHSITYSTSAARNGYTQLEGVSYTDLQWITEPMIGVATLIYYPHTIYNYFIGREGQTISGSAHCKNMWMEIKVVLHALSFFECHRPSPKEPQIRYQENKLFWLSLQLYDYYLLHFYKELQEDALKEFDSRVLELSSSIYKSLENVVLTRGPFKFHYIRHWRRKGSRSSLIFCIYYLFKKLTLK